MAQERLDALRRSAGRSLILCDFDGTLSEIVEQPDDARPLEGVVEVLNDLASRYAAVAVISGRSAGQLLGWLGPAVDIWGVHGAQHVEGGVVRTAPRLKSFEPHMREVHALAQRAIVRARLDGVLVEDKGVVSTLHYRTAREPARAEMELGRIAEELAARGDIVVTSGRKSLELRPPVALSKGAVVDDLVDLHDPEGVLFMGDDEVDLDGFDALDRLEQTGIATVKVGVSSDEAPAAVLARADLVVDGPRGALELLRTL